MCVCACAQSLNICFTLQRGGGSYIFSPYLKRHVVMSQLIINDIIVMVNDEFFRVKNPLLISEHVQ